MPRELTQEQGRNGVKFTRRWLEATTFIELPWDAYNNEEYCTLPLLGGGKKTWDLAGSFLHEHRQRIFVENKAENTPGHQAEQFREFLANAYSSSARQRELIEQDAKHEYFWVTSHPFGSVSRWASCATKQAVVDAVRENNILPDGATIDEDLAALVSDRIWLLVVNEKQERLSLQRSELDIILAVLKRKEDLL